MSVENQSRAKAAETVEGQIAPGRLEMTGQRQELDCFRPEVQHPLSRIDAIDE